MIDMGNAGSGHRLRGGREGTAATRTAPWAATERPTAGARRNTHSGCTFWTLSLRPTLWHGRPSSSTRCASLAVVLALASGASAPMRWQCASPLSSNHIVREHLLGVGDVALEKCNWHFMVRSESRTLCRGTS